MSHLNPLAVVTGASSGIGAVFVQRLAAAGYNLLLVARRRERLEALAKQLHEQNGVEAEVLSADLTVESDLHKVEQRIAGAADLEFLVNNAGFGTRGRFFEADPESQDKMLRLHIIATLRLTRAALAGMVARGKGNIVNVSSVAAFSQSSGNVCYSATKAWINSFTEGLYLELKACGSRVRIQALCPGFTITEFHERMGVDRNNIPSSWWMSAESVVDASFRGLEKNRLFVVPGAMYHAFVVMLKLLPQPLRHALAIRYGFKRRAVPTN
jgi:short-subunit dehydrogenase